MTRKGDAMTASPNELKSGDALIIVDVQNDFCPGGALPIERGDEVVPILNDWITAATNDDLPIYASRDYHPKGHMSFDESGGPWPLHCIQDSDGAQFHPDLNLPAEAVVVTKGVRLDQDQNSAFDQTGLATELNKHGVDRVFVGGLAEDVCVLATALDGRREGFDVVLIQDATRPVTAEGGASARQQMRAAGVRLSA